MGGGEAGKAKRKNEVVLPSWLPPDRAGPGSCVFCVSRLPVVRGEKG